jgi:hypothetical protein
MSQNQQILNHLQKASITPLEALTKYGCLRLAARIKELKDVGHQINRQMIYLGDKKFAKYSLIQRKEK